MPRQKKTARLKPRKSRVDRILEKILAARLPEPTGTGSGKEAGTDAR